MNRDELVSARDLASWLGVSDRTVRELAERGILVRSAKGKYALKSSVTAYTDHLRSAAAGRGGEDASTDLAAQRARLAREQADGLALKNATARSTLIPAAEVAARWNDVARRVRGRVLAVPGRVRAQLPHLPAADVAAVDREVRLALDELADAGA